MPIDPSDAPRQIGDYRILRRLGAGGMGTVYEAEELLSHRRVALKILHADLGQTDEGRRRFVAEMNILASLDDPNVVRCLHCSEIAGQLVMVLEYLEGRTLRELLNARGQLPWAEVVDLAKQIASALRAAHTRVPAVIHRDLKPENVMCLPDGRAKVLDFGIAKIVQANRNTTTQSIGTLQYMSPEQIDARPVDNRSDLFALGLLMWEMLAGHPVFQAESPRVLLEAVCTRPTPRLPDAVRRTLPAGMEALIDALLAKQASARPADAGSVLDVLASFTTPQPAAASPAPSLPQYDTIEVVESARRPRSKPESSPIILTVAGLIVAGLGIVGLSVGAFDSGRTEQGSTTRQPAQIQTAAPSPTAPEEPLPEPGPPPTDDPHTAAETQQAPPPLAQEPSLGVGASFGDDDRKESGKGKVTQGKETVEGALDRDLIRRIVRTHINEVRSCYDKGLSEDPKLEGKVVINFVIAGTGKVPSAVVREESTTIDDRTVANCIAKAVKRWVFPKPRGGGNVIVDYPFNLTID